MADRDDAVLTPYARSLGLEIDSIEDAVPILKVAFSQDVEGRPEHYHGGATGGLLETAGYAALRAALRDKDRTALLKPINITVQYLSAGKAQTSYAKGRVTKLGRRSANLTVEAWQDDRSRPIATAVMNVLMADPKS